MKPEHAEGPPTPSLSICTRLGGLSTAEVQDVQHIPALVAFPQTVQAMKKGFAVIVGGTGTPIRVRIDGASAS